MYELLKQAEDVLPQLLGDAGKWNSSVQHEGASHTLSVWRQFGQTKHHVVLQIFTGEHSASPTPYHAYIARVVKGICRFEQSIELEKMQLEQVASGELTPGSVLYLQDPDGWQSIRPMKRDLLLVRVSAAAADNDYCLGKPMNTKNLEWLLTQFGPSYE